MTARTCEYCFFYREGACKRFPPIVIYVVQGKTLTETGYVETGGTQSFFPGVDKEEWCGEWKPN